MHSDAICKCDWVWDQWISGWGEVYSTLHCTYFVYAICPICGRYVGDICAICGRYVGGMTACAYFVCAIKQKWQQRGSAPGFTLIAIPTTITVQLWKKTQYRKWKKIGFLKFIYKFIQLYKYKSINIPTTTVQLWKIQLDRSRVLSYLSQPIMSFPNTRKWQKFGFFFFITLQFIQL